MSEVPIRDCDGATFLVDEVTGEIIRIRLYNGVEFVCDRPIVKAAPAMMAVLERFVRWDERVTKESDINGLWCAKPPNPDCDIVFRVDIDELAALTGMAADVLKSAKGRSI